MPLKKQPALQRRSVGRLFGLRAGRRIAFSCSLPQAVVSSHPPRGLLALVRVGAQQPSSPAAQLVMETASLCFFAGLSGHAA